MLKIILLNVKNRVLKHKKFNGCFVVGCCVFIGNIHIKVARGIFILNTMFSVARRTIPKIRKALPKKRRPVKIPTHRGDIAYETKQAHKLAMKTS